MRWNKKIAFAIDMIIEKPINFLITILLGGLGLGLIGFTMLVYLAGRYGYDSVERVLTQGTEQTGRLMFDDYGTEAGTAFRKEAFSSDIIHSIGSYRFIEQSSMALPELFQIQQGHTVNDSIKGLENGQVHMFFIDEEIKNLCALEFEKLLPQEKRQNTKENIQYLYLGYAYRDIPVGKEFVWSSQGVTLHYQVRGILKKGSRFVADSLMNSIGFTDISNSINLDYEIISTNEGPSKYCPWIFSIDRKYSYDEGVKELRRIAAKHGIELSDIRSFSSFFEQVALETKMMQESLVEMMILLLFATGIVVTVLQLVQIFNKSHFYGILYSIGVLTPDIVMITIIRNVVCFLFSEMIGTFLLILTGNYFFITNIQNREMFFELLFRTVLPVGTAGMLLLFAVTTAIPCVVFGRLDPVKLLQGD